MSKEPMEIEVLGLKRLRERGATATKWERMLRKRIGSFAPADISQIAHSSGRTAESGRSVRGGVLSRSAVIAPVPSPGAAGVYPLQGAAADWSAIAGQILAL